MKKIAILTTSNNKEKAREFIKDNFLSNPDQVIEIGKENFYSSKKMSVSLYIINSRKEMAKMKWTLQKRFHDVLYIDEAIARGRKRIAAIPYEFISLSLS